jgi:hypothetical protein
MKYWRLDIPTIIRRRHLFPLFREFVRRVYSGEIFWR